MRRVGLEAIFEIEDVERGELTVLVVVVIGQKCSFIYHFIFLASASAKCGVRKKLPWYSGSTSCTMICKSEIGGLAAFDSHTALMIRPDI